MELDYKKRNYVKRKRSVNESAKLIANVLRKLNENNGVPINDEEINDVAANYAKTIEATCWSRKAKYSDEEFQILTQEKTTELCNTLLRQSQIPNESLSMALNNKVKTKPKLNIKKNIKINKILSPNISDLITPLKPFKIEQRLNKIDTKLFNDDNCSINSVPTLQSDISNPILTNSEPSNDEIFDSLWGPNSNQNSNFVAINYK